MSATGSKVSVRPAVAEASTQRFADDVRYYLELSPRQLPSRYLYDALGSALFDAICHLPWYGLTRAETRLLVKYGAEILKWLAPLSRVIELGSGNGEKLSTLIRAGGPRAAPLQLHLIDVSEQALQTAVRALVEFDAVELVTHQAPYESGLEQMLTEPPRADGRSLALFLGSNIGNYDPPGADALLRQIRASLDPGDAFLLGSDLPKPEQDLLMAYDDPLGVTAAFNRNLLVRINRELDADFDVASFAHRAIWNRECSRVEMHLVSSRRQQIRVAAAGIDLSMEPREHIWTESSYKYQPDHIVAMLERAGFHYRRQWIDEAGMFALTMVEVCSSR